MISKKGESLANEIYQSNENIKTICLLSADGTISLFLTKNSIEEGEKKRLAASIMASVVLAERSIVNLVQEHVKHVVIKGENAVTVIFITKTNNYVYILGDSDFDYRTLVNLEFDF